MSCFRPIALLLCFTCVSTPLFAVETPAQGPTDVYRSVFSDYKRYQDPEVMSWKTANNVVMQADGMAGHSMGTMKALPDGKMDSPLVPDTSRGILPADKQTPPASMEHRGTHQP